MHYVKQEDAAVHDALLCIQTGKKLADTDRMRFEGTQFYLKSGEEMRELFPDVPEALENTMKIARRCHVDLDFSTMHLPGFTAPDGMNNGSYLRRLVEEGLHERYTEISDTIRSRAEFELQTIESMGYVDYFLIVWDFIRYARSKDIIVGPGRGAQPVPCVLCLRYYQYRSSGL